MRTLRLLGLSLLGIFILGSLFRMPESAVAQTPAAAPEAAPSPQAAPAASAEKIALVEELLGVLKVEEAVNVSFEKVLGMQKGMMQQSKLSPEAQAQQMKIMEAVMAETKKVINWSTISADYIQIYADAFSEEDLRGLIAFFKTPLGQSYVQKQPAIQEAMAQKMQGLMMQLIPQIQATAQKMMAEQQAAASAAASPDTSPAASPAATPQ